MFPSPRQLGHSYTNLSSLSVTGTGDRVFRAVEYAKTRRAEMVQFIMRQYKMERDISESVYDAIMETLNPTLWLTDQEIQIELNRIAEQSKTKITMKPAELADFTLTRQVAQEFGK